MNKHFIGILFTLSIFLFLTSEVMAAKFFRFTDENGKMVVSSSLPPEVSQKGYDIVNEMGVVLETVAPRKTKQQLREELANKARMDEEARRLKEQKQLDFILINSYTDISDIERARDNELISKERDIMLLKQNIRRLTRLVEDTQTRAARDERLGKEISKSLLSEIEGYKDRIDGEGKEVKKVESHKIRITERYYSSIIRFNELMAAEQLRKYRPGELEQGALKAIIYNCSSSAKCDSAWQAALLYASENSTTELAWANESTIMMRKPRKDDDISVMLTRVKSLTGGESSLVFEVRCNKSRAGEELCDSDTVKSIESGFATFVD